MNSMYYRLREESVVYSIVLKSTLLKELLHIKSKNFKPRH